MRYVICLFALVALAACGDDSSGSGSSSGVDEAVAYPLGQICTFERWQVYAAEYTYTEGSPDYTIERAAYGDPEEPPVCVRMTWDEGQDNWGGFTVSEGVCADSGELLTTVSLTWDPELPKSNFDLGDFAPGQALVVALKGGLKTVSIQNAQGTSDLDFSGVDPFILVCDEANPVCRYTFCDGTKTPESFPDGT